MKYERVGRELLHSPELASLPGPLQLPGCVPRRLQLLLPCVPPRLAFVLQAGWAMNKLYLS